MTEVNPIPKPTRADDGAFKRPPAKQCIKCGRWYPGGIERHHGIPRSRGGPNTEANRFDLCGLCHGKAQRNEPGYRLTDLEAAKAEAEKWARITERIFGQ